MTVPLQSKLVHGDGVSKLLDVKWLDGCAEVATPYDLAALDDSLLYDGLEVRVSVHKCGWKLDKTSTLPSNQVTIIRTLSGTGRWIRLDVDNNYFTFVPNFFINEVSGSDNASGTATGASALRTVAELGRRFKNQLLTGTIDVAIETDLTIAGQTGSIDIRDISFAPLPGTFIPIVLAFHGTPTTVRTGSVTAYSGPNVIANQLSTLDDAGATSTDRNRRIINTTAGGRLNSSAWFGKNIYSGTARITSDWGKSNYGGAFGIFSTTTVTPPLVGDTFAVQTLPTFPLANVQALGGLGNGIVFDQLQITGGSVGLNVQQSFGMITYFYNCDINTAQNNCFAPTNFVNCSIRAGGIYVRSIVENYAGIISTVNTSATSPSDGAYIFPGGYYTEFNLVSHDQCRGTTAMPGGWGRLYGGGYHNIGSAVSANVFGSQINVNTGGTIEHRKLAGSEYLFGSGSTRTGVTVAPGGFLTSNDWTRVSVTGNNNFTGFDFEINKKNATLKAWSETSGSYVTVTSGTWNYMNTAVVSGGFGGYAHDPETNTCISLVQGYP